MLQYLHVKNLALIDEAEVDFTEGFNILTGETGAGKSIIIGSIALALGEKVPKELLREGADSLVELVFTVDEETEERLSAIEITPEDRTVILTRKIVNGHSSARINSETVTAGKLKEAAALLIDVHGQHEHQSLLHRAAHLRILDDFAGAELLQEKEAYRADYQTYLALQKKKDGAALDETAQQRELSLLRFEIGEIEDANLTVGEDETLETDYRRFTNGKKILDALNLAHGLLSEGEENAAELIGRASKEVQDAAGYDTRLSELSGQLVTLESLIADAGREIGRYLSDEEFDEQTFRETEERLTIVNRLKEKYGGTLEKVLEALAEKKEREAELSDYERFLAKLEAELAEIMEKLSARAKRLTALRKAAAESLCKEICDALVDLNFLDVRFTAEFVESEKFLSDGKDEMQFLIAVNPGEPLLPLSKVASGGELSRIMLALKTVLADEDRIGTLIFDEIDAGISGRTAQAVAEKLHALAKTHQIICITHLPQIAAQADTHFLIEKSVTDGATVSSIRALSEEESIEELARLLGGREITDTVRQNAREMKLLAGGKTV